VDQSTDELEVTVHMFRSHSFRLGRVISGVPQDLYWAAAVLNLYIWKMELKA